MDRDNTPVKELEEGALYDSEEHDKEKSRDTSRHRHKDKKRSRRDEKDHRSAGDRDPSKINDDSHEREKEVKDPEKERTSSKEKRKEDRDGQEKDRAKDKHRERDHDKHKVKDHDRDKDGKDRGRKHDRERERENETESNRGRDKERGKEKSKDKEKDKEKEKEREKEKTKDRDRGKDRGKDKERERTRDRERDRERDHEKNRDRNTHDREQAKDSIREREREGDHGKDKSKDREKVSRRSREDHDHRREEEKHSKAKAESDDYKDREIFKQGKVSFDEDHVEDEPVAPSESLVELEQRILKVKEERMTKKSEGASEILSWVNKSRKLQEKKNSEKEKALQRSRMFEEQDNLDEDDNEDGIVGKESLDALSGVKVLHGLDKVLEGGSVVLTLKDQDILANGDVNEDVDMLENVEIGEQKRRSEAYKAAKKTTGVYDDKFSDEPGTEKKLLPQYDDPAEEQGVALGAGGRFTAEAEKKLEELRRRLQGPTVTNQAEDLNLSAKISSDYYTPEEMLQFKKPKKKKSLRKKEKLDIDALEAEAISAGLGATDLGSRNDSKRQAAREEQERTEAERRKSAYQAAYDKAEEASRALRMDQERTVEGNDTPVFADDAEDLQKSLERARKLALKKQNEKAAAGPEAIAHLALSAIQSQPIDVQNSTSGEADNKVVFTEMEEFVWGLQLDEEAQKPNHEDVFMEEDEAPKALDEKKNETGGWAAVVESEKYEQSKNEDEEEVVPDETIHEAPVGKGLSGVLKLLKDRGALKETVEWGGRNMDKKKSKLAGLSDESSKEINLERTDEYGRILTPKEAFRLLSHKFHGKGPGKMKQEKRMKQYQDELKLKQMTSSDVLPQSVERMRDAQSKLKSPYLVLSGQLKPGQTSDPRSGFATVEKEVPGSLTPMLGDKKVEHFLGIKRKSEPGSSGSTPKKPKT